MIQGHLWEIMARQKIRLKDLAAQTDISEKTIIELKYERSKNVALETINKLCAVLNCTTNDLLEYIPTCEIDCPKQTVQAAGFCVPASKETPMSRLSSQFMSSPLRRRAVNVAKLAHSSALQLMPLCFCLLETTTSLPFSTGLLAMRRPSLLRKA